MKANAKILIIICLLFLIGTGAAKIPDKVIITSDKSYLIANGVDQSTITASVSNTTLGFSGPIVGAGVNFSVFDPALGTFSPLIAVTDSNGKATSTFKVKTKSGFAIIRADVFYTDGNGIYNNFTLFTQKIDHDKAHFVTFSHPLEGPVATNVSFNTSFTDFYGNPIDQIINPGQHHSINLHVHGPTPDDCGFVGYGHDILSQNLDTNGNVAVRVHLSSGAGPNSVTMDPFEEIVTPVPRIITGISTDVSDMEQLFFPDFPAQVPADGVSKFSIQYTFFDKFRNPVSQQEVWVNTSVVGEEFMNKTDSLGRLIVTYGPRSTIGIINITATAVNNKTVTRSHEVEFTSTAATLMVLTANPEYMPSRDVPPSSSTSTITATVTDISGNPVDNETVTFSLGVVGYPDGPYNVTSVPSLTNLSATTDAAGQATVQFIPGSFSTNSSALYYSPTATGNVTITAMWNTIPKNILVSWKNYPYLSVKTSVNPQTVEVNDTVDVTISLKADGWAMQPKPIDVLLLLDNSGSMGSTSDSNSGLSKSKQAAISFVNNMTQGKDRVGVIFYDKKTYPAFSVYVPLTYDLTSVRNSISGYTRTDGRGYHTRTRYALYQGIWLMNTWNDRGAVPAIIHMTDGQWSMEGDPLARAGAIGFNQSFSPLENVANGLHSVWAGNVVGVTNKYRYFDDLGGGSAVNGNRNDFPNGQTFNDGEIGWASQAEDYETTQNSTTKTSWYFTNAQNSKQNMSVYANESHIRIYSIGFTESANKTDLKLVLQTMSDANGGFYEYAPDAAKLNEIYTKIAGNLKDTASVNTTMVTDFQNVDVTNVSVPGAQVFDYIYNSSSTSGSTLITWQNTTTTPPINQSEDWDLDKKLDFTIGTMKVFDTWKATFRLKVKKSGSIDVFGKNSALLFNESGTTATLTLPHTFLTSVPDLNVTGFGIQTIDVSSSCPVLAPQTFILPIIWTTTYTGPANTISEEVLYISESGAHVPFFHWSYPVSGDTIMTKSAQLDLRTVPQGNYAIQVISKSSLAAATSQSCGNYTYSMKGATFIKLD